MSLTRGIGGGGFFKYLKKIGAIWGALGDACVEKGSKIYCIKKLIKQFPLFLFTSFFFGGPLLLVELKKPVQGVPKKQTILTILVKYLGHFETVSGALWYKVALWSWEGSKTTIFWKTKTNLYMVCHKT